MDKRVKGKLVRKHGKIVKVSKKVTTTVPEPLIMPTEITGQNGAKLTQQTKIQVTGCKTATVKKTTKKPAKKKKPTKRTGKKK